jgi:hypothetical protein
MCLRGNKSRKLTKSELAHWEHHGFMVQKKCFSKNQLQKLAIIKDNNRFSGPLCHSVLNLTTRTRNRVDLPFRKSLFK